MYSVVFCQNLTKFCIYNNINLHKIKAFSCALIEIYLYFLVILNLNSYVFEFNYSELKYIKMYNMSFKYFKVFLLSFFIFLCSSCTTGKIMPSIVPGVEVKRDTGHALGIIGEIEPVYILPMKSPFIARIDTGATTSSIDVDNQKTFERDGRKWVSFTITNRESGEIRRFEKKVEKSSKIVRIENNEERTVVLMEIRMGNQTIREMFSLAKREKFNYQVLIGRNILTGRAIVDTALKNTLK